MDKEENKQTKLTDEEVWLKYMVAMIANPYLADNSASHDAKMADIFLQEFKKRFRND